MALSELFISLDIEITYDCFGTPHILQEHLKKHKTTQQLGADVGVNETRALSIVQFVVTRWNLSDNEAAASAAGSSVHLQRQVHQG